MKKNKLKSLTRTKNRRLAFSKKLMLLERLLLEAKDLNEIYENYYKNLVGKGLFDFVSKSLTNDEPRTWMKWVLNRNPPNYKTLKSWLGEGNEPSTFIESEADVKANAAFMQKIDKLRKIIEVYTKLRRKKQLPPFHDKDVYNIFQTWSIEDFITYYDELLKPYGEAVIHNFDRFFVYEPKTFESSYLHVQDTSICTKHRDNFNSYMSEDQLYIIREKKGNQIGSEIYQLHFQSDQYKDKLDKPFNLEILLNDKSLMRYFRDLCLSSKLDKFSTKETLTIGNGLVLELHYIPSLCHFFVNTKIHLEIIKNSDIPDDVDRIRICKEKISNKNESLIFYYLLITNRGSSIIIKTDSEKNGQIDKIYFDEYKNNIADLIYNSLNKNTVLSLRNGWKYVENQLPREYILTWLDENLTMPIGLRENNNTLISFENLIRSPLTIIKPNGDEYRINEKYDQVYKNGSKITISEMINEIPVEVFQEIGYKVYNNIKIIETKEKINNIGCVKTINLNPVLFIFKFPKIVKRILKKTGNIALNTFEKAIIKTLYKDQRFRYDIISLNKNAVTYVAKHSIQNQNIIKDEFFVDNNDIVERSEIIQDLLSNILSHDATNREFLFLDSLIRKNETNIAKSYTIATMLRKTGNIDLSKVLKSIKEQNEVSHDVFDGIVFFLADELDLDEIKDLGYRTTEAENLINNNHRYIERMKRCRIHFDGMNVVRTSRETLENILNTNNANINTHLVQNIIRGLEEEGDYLEMLYEVKELNGLTTQHVMMAVVVWRYLKNRYGEIKINFSNEHPYQSADINALISVIELAQGIVHR